MNTRVTRQVLPPLPRPGEFAKSPSPPGLPANQSPSSAPGSISARAHPLGTLPERRDANFASAAFALSPTAQVRANDHKQLLKAHGIPVDLNFDKLKLGPQIGTGQFKDAFPVIDKEGRPTGLVLLKLKSRFDTGDAVKEGANLLRLQGMGFKVVDFRGIGKSDGHEAILMTEYDDVLKPEKMTEPQGIEKIRHSPNVNEKTVLDLFRIQNLLRHHKDTEIQDIQCAIDRNGRLLIADPLDIKPMTPEGQRSTRKTLNDLDTVMAILLERFPHMRAILQSMGGRS